MSWIELKINVPYDSLEKISGYLFALGCEGISVTDEDILIYFTEYKWTDENKLGLVEYIRQVIPEFSFRDLQINSIADRDWNQDWKKSFQPLRITGRIIIVPPWEKPRVSQGEIVIIINPKMAFGTGHHESTQLVIIALEKFVKKNMQVLDVGTGSGILAFVSKKLGAESIVAIDHDSFAIRNAQENAVLNGITGEIKFYHAQLEQLYKNEYDLICANMNKNILLKYATIFPWYLKEDGIIIISGILRNDEPEVLKIYYRNGFKLVKKSVKKEWVCLTLQLKKGGSFRIDKDR
jgi:ribosomal protein L11 methyltransferase